MWPRCMSGSENKSIKSFILFLRLGFSITVFFFGISGCTPGPSAPEAEKPEVVLPVPVLLEESQSYSIGGAGNLALNIQSINGSVALHGSVGQDKEGMKVTELLKQNQFSRHCLRQYKMYLAFHHYYYRFS